MNISSFIRELTFLSGLTNLKSYDNFKGIDKYELDRSLTIKLNELRKMGSDRILQ